MVQVRQTCQSPGGLGGVLQMGGTTSSYYGRLDWYRFELGRRLYG